MKKTWILVAVLVMLGLLVGAIAIGCGEVKKEGEPTANLTAQALLKSFTGSNIFTSGTNSGTISGKITDMLTGNPLVGTTVSAGSKSATTNSSGNYTLSGVTPGEVTFSTNASGYEDISIVCNSSTINIGLLAEVRSPTGTISGKVTDSSGQPVSGAVVSAASETYFQETAKSTITDSNGNYTLTNEAGDVVVIALGHASGVASQYKRINLGASATVNFQYSANSGTISGTITNNSANLSTSFVAGLVVGGTMVSIGVDPATGGQYSCVVPPTQGSDTYLITGFGWKSAGGQWFWPCDYVSVSAGQTLTRNFTVQEPIQQVSPTDEAVVSATPTLTWQAGTGSTFDFYILDVYASIYPSSKRIRRIITENLSYTLSAAESLTSGDYFWSIAGFNVTGAYSISSFDPSKITIAYYSQHAEYDFTVP
jgi:hypothetical protein